MARLKTRLGPTGYFDTAGETAARTGLKVPETGFFGREFDVQDFQRIVSGATGAFQLGKSVYDDIIQPIKRDYERSAREEEVAQARKDAAKKQLEMQRVKATELKEFQEAQARFNQRAKDLAAERQMQQQEQQKQQQEEFANRMSGSMAGILTGQQTTIPEMPQFSSLKPVVPELKLDLSSKDVLDMSRSQELFDDYMLAKEGREYERSQRENPELYMSDADLKAIRQSASPELYEIARAEEARQRGMLVSDAELEEMKANAQMRRSMELSEAFKTPISTQLTQPDLLKQVARLQLEDPAQTVRPAQQTRFAPTGVPVSPLQARTSASPLRAQAPVAAPQPRVAQRPMVSAQSSNQALMADPANRAFVRSIVRQQKMSGEPESVEAAIDLLRLEIAKRGTPATAIVDVEARKVLTEDPKEAAKRMTLSNVYNLASQSTVADWPKIEPLAREVIKKQGGYGFFEGPNVDAELEKVRKMLANKRPAVPGIEFDLSGAAKTARETAKSFKDRQTKEKKVRYKGTLPSMKALTGEYLKPVKQPLTIGGQTSPRQIFVETEKLVKLRKKIDAGKGTSKDRAILDKVAEEQNRLNNRATAGVPGLSASDAAENRKRQTQRDYGTAKNNLNASEKRLSKAQSSLKAIDDKIEEANRKHQGLSEEEQLKKAESHENKLKKLEARRTRAQNRVATEERTRDTYKSEVLAIEEQIPPGTVP